MQTQDKKRKSINNISENSSLILTPNFEKDCYALWLGNYKSALDENFLKQSNISLVITAAANLNITFTNKFIKHMVIPIQDTSDTNVSRYFNNFNSILDDHLKKGNVLGINYLVFKYFCQVHCAAGVSRSPTFVIVYLMHRFKWSFKIAIDYVQNKRPMINPNPGFIKQMEEFQQKMQGQTEVKKQRIQTSPKEFQKNVNQEKFEFNQEDIYRYLSPQSMSLFQGARFFSNSRGQSLQKKAQAKQILETQQKKTKFTGLLFSRADLKEKIQKSEIKKQIGIS